VRRKFHITTYYPDNKKWIITRGGFAKPLLRMACSILLNEDYNSRFILEPESLAIFPSEVICRRCLYRTHERYGKVLFRNYGSGLFTIKERNLGQNTVDFLYFLTKNAIYTNYGRVA